MKRKLNKKKYIIYVIIICLIALALRLFVFGENPSATVPLAIGTVFCFFGAYYLAGKPQK